MYLTILVKGASETGMKTTKFFKKFYHAAHQEALTTFVEKQQEKLDQAVREALHALAEFSPRILGEVSQKATKSSELLGFLSLFVNGKASPLAYPLMDLSQYLPQRRVSTGHQTLEFSGAKETDRAYGAILSIKQYGHETDGACLRKFLTQDFEFISTHSFCPEPNDSVIDLMKKQHRRFKEVDAMGNSLTDSLEEAVDGVRSEFVSFGWHHHSVLVMSENTKKLKDSVSKAIDIYRQAQLVVVRESLNCEAGFFAQMPGNFSYIARRALISNENFADFSPLHNYHHGYQNGNHLGSSVILVESKGKTPLNLNLHERGVVHDPALGHSLIVAPSSSGKTVLLCAIDAMMKKYKGRSFFFDRDQGCEIYVRAMGGFYTRISPEKATGFNPLQLDDTPKNRAFLVYWLESLIAQNAVLPESVQKELEALVNRNYSLPKAIRRLSNIVSFLPADFPYRDNLAPWLRSHSVGKPDGALAYLFDNEEDLLDLNGESIAGFDMTHLLSPENIKHSSPVLFYLFYRLEALMNGELMGIYLDEAWQFLDNDHWLGKIQAYLLSCRKRNVYLVFVTQLLENILDSRLSSHLISGTATHLFLCNDKATTDAYIKGAKLSAAEYHFIKTTGKSTRRFLFKQGHEAATARLNLSGLEEYVRVFSGNTTSVALCESLRKQYGDLPSQWLPPFFEHYRSQA